MGVQVALCILEHIFSDVYPGVVSLDHMAVLLLVF
jgi:hypothetical protein